MRTATLCALCCAAARAGGAPSSRHTALPRAARRAARPWAPRGVGAAAGGLAGAPPSAAESARTALQALSVDYERAVAATPQLAELDPRDLRASLAFLSRYVGEERLGAFVRAHPEALLWSAAEIERLLRNELGASDAQLGRLLLGAPFLLTPRAALSACKVVSFLRAELGLSAPEALRAALAFPRLLTLPVEAAAAPGGGPPTSGLVERVRFLAEASDVPTVARAVVRHPQLLGLDLGSSLRPKAAYLASVGVDLRRLLLAHPQAFSLSFSANLQPKVAYWTAVGVPDVGAMLSAQPALASLSLPANIAPKTEFLRGLGIARLGRALQAYPQVYTLSLPSNIAPTVRFLEGCGYDVRRQLRLRHLAASLARRIVPRHELWRRHRPELGGWRPSIADLCVLGSAAYCARVGAEQAELLEVEAAIGPIVRELSRIDPLVLAAAFGADDPAAAEPGSEAGAPEPARVGLRRRARAAAGGDGDAGGGRDDGLAVGRAGGEVPG